MGLKTTIEVLHKVSADLTTDSFRLVPKFAFKEFEQRRSRALWPDGEDWAAVIQCVRPEGCSHYNPQSDNMPVTPGSVLGAASCKQPTRFPGDDSRSVLHNKFMLASFHHDPSRSTNALKKAVKLLIVFCEGKEFFRVAV